MSLPHTLFRPIFLLLALSLGAILLVVVALALKVREIDRRRSQPKRNAL